jgi:hypothetical protein
MTVFHCAEVLTAKPTAETPATLRRHRNADMEASALSRLCESAPKINRTIQRVQL